MQTETCRDRVLELAIGSSNPSTLGLLARAFDLYLRSLSKLIFRLAGLNQATFRIFSNLLAFSSIWSLYLAPLCSGHSSQCSFLPCGLCFCGHLTFPFLFVWTCPGLGYYLIIKEYTVVGLMSTF